MLEVSAYSEYEEGPEPAADAVNVYAVIKLVGSRGGLYITVNPCDVGCMTCDTTGDADGGTR